LRFAATLNRKENAKELQETALFPLWYTYSSAHGSTLIAEEEKKTCAKCAMQNNGCKNVHETGQGTQKRETIKTMY